MPDVTVVLPCLNEAASLPGVLTAIPDAYLPLVVDNNSTDDSAEVARRHGAEVVAEPRPGYGSAVHAGVMAATTPIVAVMDADGSLDPRDLSALVDELGHGADMAIGRRRPVAGLRWPWHARLGTAAVCWRLRSPHQQPVADASRPPRRAACSRRHRPQNRLPGGADGARRAGGVAGGRT
jgi:glycosyltransferase involved in cell wall biosynthesis